MLEVERGPRGRITIAVSERGVAGLFNYRKKHRQTIEYRAFMRILELTQKDACELGISKTTLHYLRKNARAR